MLQTKTLVKRELFSLVPKKKKDEGKVVFNALKNVYYTPGAENTTVNKTWSLP